MARSTELGGEARKAFAAVADALAEWREEFGESAERHSGAIAEKMAVAARAVGWPEEVIEASRTHLVQMSKIQLHMLDQLVDAWQQQLKTPVAADFLSTLRAAGARLEGPPGLAGLNPVELWMEAALAWQRNVASALALWTGGPAGRNGERTRSH
jgi:hypothetical protein